MGKQKNTEQVINDFKKIHGNKYDYSKTVYKKALEKVIITCPIHGDFLQTPNSHLSGRGCPLCGVEKGKETIKKTLNGKIFNIPDGKRKNKNNFIIDARKVHGNKYDYSKVEYINNHTKVRIICPIHGEFWQTPSNHISCKQGCPKCAIKNRTKKKTQEIEEFINASNEIHGYLYKYDKVNYKTARNKVIITCPIHGDFLQTPDNHKKGCGCPLCQSSLLEKKISKILRDNKIKYILHHSFVWLFVDKQHKQTLDFYLPEYNIAIECQGKQHLYPVGNFGSKKVTKEELYEKVKNLDIKKHDICEKHKIPILYYTEEKIGKYMWNIYTTPESLLNAINEFKHY